jgi:hypothetical protein
MENFLGQKGKNFNLSSSYCFICGLTKFFLVFSWVFASFLNVLVDFVNFFEFFQFLRVFLWCFSGFFRII